MRRLRSVLEIGETFSLPRVCDSLGFYVLRGFNWRRILEMSPGLFGSAYNNTRLSNSNVKLAPTADPVWHCPYALVGCSRAAPTVPATSLGRTMIVCAPTWAKKKAHWPP